MIGFLLLLLIVGPAIAGIACAAPGLGPFVAFVSITCTVALLLVVNEARRK